MGYVHGWTFEMSADPRLTFWASRLKSALSKTPAPLRADRLARLVIQLETATPDANTPIPPVPPHLTADDLLAEVISLQRARAAARRADIAKKIKTRKNP